MCLLDGVRAWQQDGIECVSNSHGERGNPLRVDGQLPCVALVEYAAQAAAVHAGLCGTDLHGGAAAFVGAVKSLQLHRAQVPADCVQLAVHAHCVLQSAAGAIYEFEVLGDGLCLATGRLVLAAPAA
ncbi:MAG: hypothetical protein CME59_10210 [Halioglobus sp.]|nr:hypothetical protein [Halioglobus sp.]